MKIAFDQQDIIDAICVYVAAQENRGFVEGSRPEFVKDIKLNFDSLNGITADAEIYHRSYNMNVQVIKEAIGLYLSDYYSFRADCLLINLIYDPAFGAFSADIIVEK